MAAPGPINRTLLQSFYQNAGDVYDDTKTEGAFGTIADQLDANYDYTSGLVAGGVLQPYPAFLYRQAIINGNFDVWQRGTSFVNPGSIYTADRWKISYNGTGMVHSVTQQSFTPGQTGVPNNPSFFLRRQVTTAATGQTYNVFGQSIENVNTFSGQKATVSFWAKADTARQVGVYFQIWYGSNGQDTAVTTVNLTTNWQKYTITFNLPSTSGITITANNCLTLWFTFPNNTPFIFDIAQVQVCAGDQGLPFQPRSFSDELQSCQRYYCKTFFYNVAPANGTNDYNGSLIGKSQTSVTDPETNWRFPIRMRIAPTVTLYNGRSGGVNGQWSTSALDGANARSFFNSDVSVSIDNNDIPLTTFSWFIHAAADAEL